MEQSYSRIYNCAVWNVRSFLWNTLYPCYATIATRVYYSSGCKMMEKKRRSLLREAKDEIELDKMNKQKQGKVKSSRDL